MAQVKPDEVQADVTHTLSVISGKDESKINANKMQRLFEDLGMSKEHKRACAKSFEKIACALNTNARVTRGECEKLLTVDGAIKLVAKKASTP